MVPLEYTALAEKLDLNKSQLATALRELKHDNLIAFDNTTQGIVLTHDGMQTGDYWQSREQSILQNDPLPESRAEVRMEMGYLALERSRTLPGTPEWEWIKERVEDLRHLENTMIKEAGSMLSIAATPQSTRRSESMTDSIIKVFISHSSADVEIARALIELLREAISGLKAETIRCTSVPGYKLQGGANTDNQLRQEMRDAPIFIGLLTKQSLVSTYVLFELGVRWGAQSQFTPLVAAGLRMSDLKPPLAGLHAQSCESDTDLHQMLYEITNALQLQVSGAHLYGGRLKKLVELSHSEASIRVTAGSSVAQEQPLVAKKPRVELLKPQGAKLYQDELDVWRFSPGRDDEGNGLVVPVYYDPKSDVRPEIQVRAQILFLDQVSGGRIVVPAACWIEEYLNWTTLKPGYEKHIILLVFDRDRNAFTYKSRREASDDYESPVGLVDDVPVPPTPQTVTITLFWDDDRETQSYSFETPDRRSNPI